MARLRDFRGKRTLADLAEELGTSPASLFRIEAGEQWPGPDLISRIVEISNGEVTANDLHADHNAKGKTADEAAA